MVATASGLLLAFLLSADASSQVGQCKTPRVSIQISRALSDALAARDVRALLAWLTEERKAGRGHAAAEQLVIALHSKDAAIRWQAAQVLHRLDSDAIDALPEILRATRDPDSMVRWAAADALRDIAPKSPNAMAILLPALEDKDPLVRWAALEAISDVGPKARQAVPILVQLLSDEHAVVRREAAQALRSVVPGLPAIGMIQPEDVNAAIR